MERCALIVTDFGGIQEEATAPCIRKLVSVIRHLTERPEAVDARFGKVVGTEKRTMLTAIETTLKNQKELLENPLLEPGTLLKKPLRQLGKK